jgi:hypothetical protein
MMTREDKEDLVSTAGKHVMMARAQRELFVAKKSKARHQALLGCTGRPLYQQTYCFVTHFDQKIGFRNFASEQHWHYLLLLSKAVNIYPFGVPLSC